MTSRFALAKDKILENLDDIVRELFGSNADERHKRRTMWQVRNPWRAKADFDQMVIWLTGERRGAFKDFVSGDKGDAIGLVAFGQEGIINADTQMRAVEWIEDRYGLRKLDPATRATMEKAAADRRQDVEEKAAKSHAESRERVRKFFYACSPQILGSLAEIYLRGRGIELSEVPNLTTSFRYRENCDYWMGAARDGEGRGIGKSPQFPALISAMVSADGTLNACHLTFLEPDGSRKLDTRKRGFLSPDGKPTSPKLMKGDVAGLVVRVTNGPSGLKAEDAAQKGVAGLTGITEGLEDALTVAIANPNLRVWMAGSLAGLLTAPDHAAAAGHLIFKDNDWGKPQATALFNRAMARFRGFGKPVEEISMPADWGKDVNDALNQ